MSNRSLSRTGKIRSNRQIGEAPAIGKVSRSPESVLGAEKRSRSRSRRSRQQGSNRILIAWTAFFSIVTIGIIGAVIIFFYNWNSAPKSISNSGMPDTPDIDAAFLDIEPGELPSLDEESAIKLVRKYLESADPSLVNERFIVHSGEEAVISTLSELNTSEGAVIHVKWDGQIYSNNRVHDQLLVIREKEGKQSNRLAFLIKGDDDKWRIDFDAYMRTATPCWEDILSRSSKNSVVRVYIKSYNYYNGIYSDDRIWQAYSIVSPDIPDILYGYLKRGSPQETALKRITSANGSGSRVTLGLLSEDEAGKRQFTISRVYAEDWALAPEAYDKSF